MGATVQHIHIRRKNAALPNLCQVHLMHAELFDELNARGFTAHAGDLGENITTRGIDLLGLSTGTLLQLGDDAVVEVTGVRTPCAQMDRFQKGLMAATLDKDAAGRLIRKSGIMTIVVADGDVRAGDRIAVTLPAGPHRPLLPV